MNEVLRLNFEGACDEIRSDLLHSNSQQFSSDSMLIASHLVWKLRKPLPNRYSSVDNFSPDSLRRRFILLEHVTQIPIYSHFRGNIHSPNIHIHLHHTWASSKSSGEGVQFFSAGVGLIFQNRGRPGGGPFKSFLSNFIG